jgi:hypothetical protein
MPLGKGLARRSAMRTKADMLNELKVMLYDALLAKTRGATYPRLARAHGYVDGYMRALLDAGMATQHELLSLVSEARTSVDGPALLETRPSTDAEAAA